MHEIIFVILLLVFVEWVDLSFRGMLSNDGDVQAFGFIIRVVQALVATLAVVLLLRDQGVI